RRWFKSWSDGQQSACTPASHHGLGMGPGPARLPAALPKPKEQRDVAGRPAVSHQGRAKRSLLRYLSDEAPTRVVRTPILTSKLQAHFKRLRAASDIARTPGCLIRRSAEMA